MDSTNKGQLKKINGFGYWVKNPERGFQVNANIEGLPPAQWYVIPHITQMAEAEAKEKGVGLGDIADEWNERLRALEPKPLFSYTWTADLNDEEYKAFLDAFGF